MTTQDELVYSTDTTMPMIYSTETTTPVFYPDDTTTTVPLRPNCSVYNPCGRYGYCENNLHYEWTCVCKFWWNGTRCDEQSSSGQQVIALGVMVGILLILFYGILLFRVIRKKRKLSKIEQKPTTKTINRTFPTIHITAFRPSHRMASWITGILTLILATVSLLAKWAIIKPIHEEIVDKFKNNESLLFKKHSVCRVIDLSPQFNLFTFPVACLLILLFIIITKRVSSQRNKCLKGYIGIPIPLDFFAHVKRSLAAVIFAIFADELLKIVLGKVNGTSQSTNNGIIVRYILQILNVVIIGFRRYPILAAVYIDNYFSLVCATLYVWLDYSISILYNGLCKSDIYLTDDNYNTTGDDGTITYFKYYGTGSKLIFLQLLPDIPRYLCLAYISVKLPVLLIKHIRQRKLIDRRLTREQKNLLYSSLPHSAESRYVKRLLGMSNTETPTNRCASIFRHIYTWRDDFRFSSRVVCTYASIFLMLFFFTVQACVKVLPLLPDLHDFFQDVVDAFSPLISSLISSPDPNLQEPDDPSADFPLPDFARPFMLAIFTTLIITLIQLLVMLAGIRRNLLQSFRGDASEIPRRTASHNVSYITGSFHFAGYLIGYVVVAYLLILFIALVVYAGIEAFITFGSVKVIDKILEGLIPFILFVIFKTYLNKILGQYAFLQYGGEVLSINNRRAFMVFLYFNFFLDAFLGLFAAFMRILKGIFGGILYMCRLDYSPLGRKLETMDSGFNAYRGLIYTECAHRHPILLCFVSHLLRAHLYPTQTKRLSKAKHRWRLAVLLLNNPILIYRRKGFLSHIQENEIKVMLIGGNGKEMFIEQPPIMAHRASIVSEKGLDELWERRRF